MIHASCMRPVRVDASLSHLMAGLLSPFVSHAKNLSTPATLGLVGLELMIGA